MANLKLRSAVLAVLGLRAGDPKSDTSNYTDFSTVGRQTMSGSAKVWKDLWLPAMQWWGVEPSQFANPHGGTTATTGSPGTAAPFDLYGGASGSANNGSRMNVPVLAPSAAENTDMRAATTFVVPPDAASTGGVYATLYFFLNGTFDTAGSIEALRLRYRYYGSKGKNNGGASGSVLYAASMASTGSGAMEIHTIGSIASFTQASPLAILELGVENSSTCAYALAPGENIIGLKLRYLSENIGGSAYNA